MDSWSKDTSLIRFTLTSIKKFYLVAAVILIITAMLTLYTTFVAAIVGILSLLFYAITFRIKKTIIDFNKKKISVNYNPIVPFIKPTKIDRLFTDLESLMIYNYEDIRQTGIKNNLGAQPSIEFIIFSIITKNDEEIILKQLSKGFTKKHLLHLTDKFNKLAESLDIKFIDEKNEKMSLEASSLTGMSEIVENRDTIVDEMNKMQASYNKNKKFKIL